MEAATNHRTSLRAGALLLLTACSKTEPKTEPAFIDAGPPPGVSLLQQTPSRLAVEWQFESGTSGERRADPFRGWKGRWLAARIPSDAHVSAISMTVKAPMRIAIFRDGTKLKEASVKENAVVPLDASGGDLRVDVLGEPSEIRDFDVLGQPGAVRSSVAKLPEVRYASLDMGEHVSGPWPDLASYCEKMHGDRCNESTSAWRRTTAAPIADIGSVRGSDGDRIAVKTKRGWFVLRAAKSYAWESLRVETPEAGTPFLRFEHVDRSEMAGAHETFIEATRWLVVCRILDDWPNCDERHELAKFAGAIAGKDAGPLSWPDAGVPSVLVDGGVVVR